MRELISAPGCQSQISRCSVCLRGRRGGPVCTERQWCCSDPPDRWGPGEAVVVIPASGRCRLLGSSQPFKLSRPAIQRDFIILQCWFMSHKLKLIWHIQDFCICVLLPCLKHKSDSSLTALIVGDSILGQLVRVFQSWWRYPCSVRAATKVELSLKLHRCQQRHLNTLCPLKFTDYCCPPEEVHRSIGAPYAPIEGHVPTC